MSNEKIKYYLRPFGTVGRTDGLKLCRINKALCVNGVFFTKIELISRNKKILKDIFSIEDFLRKLKKNKSLSKLFKNLTNMNPKLNTVLCKRNDFSIFGILNITPDSFSDGGKNFDMKKAIASAETMVKNGADFIDVGGESTRPGAEKIEPETEISRVMPVIQKLNNKNIDISLDTRNASTMELGVLSGVKIINDVSGLKHDKKSVDVINKYEIPIIIMHMPGNPKNMVKKNKYSDVLLDVYDFLEERIEYCIRSGIKRNNIIVDPGIGFGKDTKQNLKLLQNISVYHSLGCPIMLGVSRKRFISEISNEDIPKRRLGGTISATLLAMHQGVKIHRVHDVKQINEAIRVFEKIIN
ncbi:MAG: dihydropteroate synthase [Pseudomonadota bacterium]|nr:dihydropteroate synthase [Pseudomonadota bacterium]